jgi:hypothetical protein
MGRREDAGGTNGENFHRWLKFQQLDTQKLEI